MKNINDPYSRSMSVLEAMIANDEGFREEVYRCPAGKLTIGYGYNISAGMPEDEALVLMRYRLAKLHDELSKRFEWYETISDNRQRALLNMAYQLGLGGLLGFKRMLADCAAGDWEGAYENALDSKWALSDAPARAIRVASLLRSG